MLGMDIDAGTWRWNVASRAVSPASLMLVMLIVLASGMVLATSGAKASVKPVQRRLMIPLALVLMLLAGSFWVVLFRTQQEKHESIQQRVLEEAADELSEELIEQSLILKMKRMIG